MFVETKAPGEAPVKAKPQYPSLDGFIAWLETKDPQECYHFPDCKACACGQYSASLGEFWLRRTEGGVVSFVYHGLNELARAEPWTFGALLKRAKSERSIFGRVFGL
jgi:hypothetical protein